jgi:spore maturation protein CgeB
LSPLRIVILGLSITSSWGNGHATNYRGLLRALAQRGHDVLFLERDVPWYAANRDLPRPPHGQTALYHSVDELRATFSDEVRDADLVIVGSYVPEGIAVGRWAVAHARGVRAFYDIDTPVTLAAVAAATCDYIDRDLIAASDVYLSFTAGPTLELLEERYGAASAVAFHCLVDPEVYAPAEVPLRWDLGYLGTYSDDRQPALERLLLEPARRRPDLRFVVAGPQYPDGIDWPGNVERIEHLPPAAHADFYNAQRLTLNITRADMVRAGWSPSVRLFEAAACAVPVVSDRWDGLDEFFRPQEEIIIADTAEDVVAALDNVDEAEARRIGGAARRRVLAEHTAEHRAAQLEALAGVGASSPRGSAPRTLTPRTAAPKSS